MSCPNPVAFTVFGHDIYWYGILISLSVVLAVVMVYSEAKRKGLDADCMLDYALLTVPTAIVFARLYYVIFEWDQYAANPIHALFIWEGGIAIYGSILGGIVATLIFSKWKKISFWTLADLVAPGLVLGQAIGRWGNFFNQEAFGELVTNPDLQFFPYAVYIERLGEWHMATFFRKAKNAPAGNLLLWYWVLYGIERAYVEGLRTDSLWIFKGGIPIGNLIFFPNGLRVSQVLSIIMVIAFGTVLIVRAVKRHKKQTVEDETAPLDPSLQLVSEDGAAEAESADESAPAPEAEVSASEEPESAGESAQPEEPESAEEEPAAEKDKDGEEAEENK